MGKMFLQIRSWSTLPLLLFGLCFASISLAAELSRNEVLLTFKNYESLNADFISSVGKGHGKSGKSYSALREEVESFAEGPFVSALNGAQTQVCSLKDAEVLNALFQVVFVTSNSASETPASTLGNVFFCQPDLVITTFNSLSSEKRKSLYNALEFGFENVTYQMQEDEMKVSSLRHKLKSIRPDQHLTKGE